MIIKGLGASFPSRNVSNAEVPGYVKAHSEPLFDGDVGQQLSRIPYLLDVYRYARQAGGF